MTIRSLGAGVLITLALGSPLCFAEAYTPVTLTEDQEASLKRVITKDFLDPEAVRLRNIKAGKNTADEIIVCGEVNGKNRMGGYVGYNLFVASLIKGRTEWGGVFAQPETEQKMLDFCVKNGLADQP